MWLFGLGLRGLYRDVFKGLQETHGVYTVIPRRFAGSLELMIPQNVNFLIWEVLYFSDVGMH